MGDTYFRSRYVKAVKRPGADDWLLYDFRTRKFILMNELQKMIYDCAPYTELSSHFLRSLYETGFLVDFDEYEALKERQERRQLEDKGVHLGICPTMSCNFSCRYCIETSQVRPGRMSEKTQENVLHWTKELLSDAKDFSLIWFGGEPMLAMDIIEKTGTALYDHCRQKDLDFTSAIYTNGYFLNEKNIRILENAGVSCVRISMDGSQTGHDRMRHLKTGEGSYLQIMENLRIPTKMTYRIRCNMQRENLTEYEILVDRLRDTAEKSGNRIIVSPERMRVEKDVDPSLKALELSYPEYYEFFRKARTLKVAEDNKKLRTLLVGKPGGMTCNAARRRSFQIDEHGNIYKCNWFLGKEDHVLANVNDLPSAEQLNATSEALFFLDKKIAAREKCKNCVLLPVCLGRCPISWEIKDKYDCMREIKGLDEALLLAYEAFGKK